MKKIIFTFVAFISFLNLIGQNLKSYTGAYQLSYSLLTNGQASYTYYEKDGSDIKQGKFSFTGSSSNNKGSINIKINGLYKNGLKSGIWNYSVTIKEQGGNKTISMTLQATYTDGLPNGQWSASLIGKEFNTIQLDTKLTANFKSGCFVQDFNFNFKSAEKTQEANLKFDDSGFYLSEKSREDQNSSTFNYYRGVLIDDEIGFEKTKEIVDKIDLYSNQLDSLNNIPYKLKKIKADLPFNTHDLLFSFMYLFQDINGDVNYMSTDYQNNVDYRYDGFNYYMLVEQKTTDSFYNEKIIYADQAYNNKKFKQAIDFYNEALQFKKTEYANNMIIECNRLLKDIEELKQKKINLYVSEGDSFFIKYKFKESKSFYEKAIDIDYNNYASNRIRLITDFEQAPDKYYKIANNFSQSNKLDSAIHYYRIVYYYFPTNPSKCNSLGWCLILSNKFEEALKLFEAIIQKTHKSNEAYPFVLGNLAHCYLFTNNFDKATSIYYNNMDLVINNMSWADAIVSDFNQFIELGIKNEHYLEIAKKLKKKKLLKIDE